MHLPAATLTALAVRGRPKWDLGNSQNRVKQCIQFDSPYLLSCSRLPHNLQGEVSLRTNSQRRRSGTHTPRKTKRIPTHYNTHSDRRLIRSPGVNAPRIGPVVQGLQSQLTGVKFSKSRREHPMDQTIEGHPHTQSVVTSPSQTKS